VAVFVDVDVFTVVGGTVGVAVRLAVGEKVGAVVGVEVAVRLFSGFAVHVGVKPAAAPSRA
jgi:hypothetical protein